MDLQLRDKVAVITGCSVGIGRAVAKVLAEEGTQTVVVARRAELLKTLRDEIQGSGALQPLVMPLDLSDRRSPHHIRDTVLGAYGRVDILISNAR